MLIESNCFDSITVMIQKEVAKRICSAPGTSDYGAFTLFVNYYMEPEILFDVSPGCFIPQPKVTSSVITMRRREHPQVKVSDEKLFFRVVRSSFANRRKTLVNGLMSSFGQFGKQQLTECIVSCGLPENVRGETLSIPQFAALADAIGKLTTG